MDLLKNYLNKNSKILDFHEISEEQWNDYKNKKPNDYDSIYAVIMFMKKIYSEYTIACFNDKNIYTLTTNLGTIKYIIFVDPYDYEKFRIIIAFDKKKYVFIFKTKMYKCKVKIDINTLAIGIGSGYKNIIIENIEEKKKYEYNISSKSLGINMQNVTKEYVIYLFKNQETDYNIISNLPHIKDNNINFAITYLTTSGKVTNF